MGNEKAYAKTARTASVANPRFRSLAAKPNSSSGSLGESLGRRPHQPASVLVVGRTINQRPYEYSCHQLSWFSTNCVMRSGVVGSLMAMRRGASTVVAG